jgi:hypothetical protein
MIEQHGFGAIAKAAHKAQACEKQGDLDEADEWRHIEAAMKIMRGPNQSWRSEPYSSYCRSNEKTSPVEGEVEVSLGRIHAFDHEDRKQGW